MTSARLRLLQLNGKLLQAAAGFFLLVLLLPLTPRDGDAQSAQRFSLHASALRISFSGNGYAGTGAGLGFEIQARYRLPLLTIGLGFQLTRHKYYGATDNSQLTGFFLDPRYVLPVRSNSIAPYVGGRFAILRQRVNYGPATLTTSGIAFGPGGGVLFRLNRKLNLDVGFTFNYASFGTGQINGTTIAGSKIGSGSSLVARAGLSYGFGK